MLIPFTLLFRSRRLALLVSLLAALVGSASAISSASQQQKADLPPSFSNEQPAFEITSAKQSYYDGERFYIHVKVLDVSLAPNLRENCPVLKLWHRSPNGETRTDEVAPMAFAGCKWKAMGEAVGDWQTGFDLDAGAHTRWGGFGEHEFRVLQSTGKTTDAIEQFAISNDLKVQVIDPTQVKREWAGRDKGVWLDLTLDKSTYQVGDEIPLHIAIQNHDATVPIYSGSTIWDPPVVQVQIVDVFGRPLPAEERFESSAIWMGHGRGPIPYEKGKIVTEELQLRGMGSLPKRPGDYVIVVTWVVSTGPEAVERIYPLLKPYTTVRASALLRIEP